MTTLDTANDSSVQLAQKVNEVDWRARLMMSADTKRYYVDEKSTELNILKPVLDTGGIVFPYTPSLDIQYRAMYTDKQLPHSNFTAHFYNGSTPGEISLTTVFTAQDDYEARYVLASLHFLRTVTKMFYGQDSNAGTPPPVLFLSAFGEYQYNNTPVLIRDVNLRSPDDVDYIQVNSTPTSAALSTTTRPQYGFSALLDTAKDRLAGIGLRRGGQNIRPQFQTDQDFFARPAPTAKPTFVPTKVEINLTMYPVHSRYLMSSQYSTRQFATGALTKKGVL